MARQNWMLVGALIVLTAGAAGAQGDNSGPLPFPKPFGDRGTRGPIGNPPISFPDHSKPPPDNSRWKDRIFLPPGGGGVIILNGSPFYSPYYYGGIGYPYGAYGYGGYSTFGEQMSFGMRFGNLGFGYQQSRTDVQVEEQPIYDTPRTYGRRSAEPARPRASDEDYYLNRKPRPASQLDRDPLLKEAVQDIETAFRTGDAARMEKHVLATDTLTLVVKGRTRQPLTAMQYLEMTREALKSLKTVRYSLDRVEPASNGAWLAYGTHVFRGEDGAERKFTVSFVLKKSADRWIISEVSADPAT